MIFTRQFLWRLLKVANDVWERLYYECVYHGTLSQILTTLKIVDKNCVTVKDWDWIKKLSRGGSKRRCKIYIGVQLHAV